MFWRYKGTFQRYSTTREGERVREREREIERDFFLKCIWEIRTDNPSLAVKILNDRERERETE